MVKIAPSILNADFSRYNAQVDELVEAGADWLHLDVMDGHYVPNLTFGPPLVAGLRKQVDLPLDVHLMISNADQFLGDFKRAGADWLTVHVEACPHLWRTLDTIHELGVKAGVTLNPATPVQQLDPVLERVELVLVMSVEPGFGGQAFIEGSLAKIEYLREARERRKLGYLIEVDGGIDTETGPRAVRAGADVLVVGTSLMRRDDIASAMAELRRAVDI